MFESVIKTKDISTVCHPCLSQFCKKKKQKKQPRKKVRLPYESGEKKRKRINVDPIPKLEN